MASTTGGFKDDGGHIQVVLTSFLLLVMYFTPLTNPSASMPMAEQFTPITRPSQSHVNIDTNRRSCPSEGFNVGERQTSHVSH